MFALELPKPPSANRYWRTDYRRQRKYVAKEGLAYRQRVQAAVWTHPERQSLPLEGRLGVEVDFVQTDRRARDVDNLFKQLLDSLEHAGVYASDDAIDDLHIRRTFRPKDGDNRVSVRVFPLAPDADSVLPCSERRRR